MIAMDKIFEPFVNLFTRSQIQTMLLAWVPSKLKPYYTGIMAVDMFMTTAIATGISTFVYIIFVSICSFLTGELWNKKSITVQIEYYTVGVYNDYNKNVIHEALSWLISQQTIKLTNGSFIVNIINSASNTKVNEYIPPSFNTLPENNHEISIIYKEIKFNVKYKIPERVIKSNNNNNNNNTSVFNSYTKQEKPSLYLSTTGNSGISIKSINDLLNEITKSYLENKKIMDSRYRHENIESRWHRIQKLSTNRGLDSIALDKVHENLLKKKIETFVNDKEFYERMGIPYRLGILLYGKPGTGKTSLINAISSFLNRDVYFLNLKTIKDDSDLNVAFSAVPSNQLIVLEDVDTQSEVLYRRHSIYKQPNNKNFKKSFGNDNFSKNNSGKYKDIGFDQFSLSTFLGCLDGHTLSEGNIIIMTTNHIEYLDPACIRPGRMDLHLELGYCTHYQIKKLFKIIVKTDLPDYILKNIPEKLLPPCEILTILTLYREDKVDTVSDKIHEMVKKYQNMDHENIKDRTEDQKH